MTILTNIEKSISRPTYPWNKDIAKYPLLAVSGHSIYYFHVRSVPILRRGWGGWMSYPASIRQNLFGVGDDY